MQPSSDEAPRSAFQNRHRGMSQQNMDRVNGDAHSNPLADQDGEPPLHSINNGPLSGDAAREGDQEAAPRSRPPGSRDDEFESFHRSFTINTNPLESLGPRSPYGPFPDASNGTDTARPAASPTPVNNAALVPPQESYQSPHRPSSPARPSEDPTIVQARRSMRARTGDRHARGKLPEPKEGRFLPPDCVPLIPPMPPSRSSKRYMKQKKRSPDVFEGVESGKQLLDDEHVVQCRYCTLDVVVKKAAIVLRCKSCGKVNPSTSLDG